jgi:hypothetical protein
VAVDNEQYRLWVASRWRVELEGGEGFRAIHRLLGSGVEYRRRDAFALDRLAERFDFVCCLGIPHRVENSLGLLRVLRGRTVSGGTVLVETYGVGPEDRNGPAIRVSEPGEVYARDSLPCGASRDLAVARARPRRPGPQRQQAPEGQAGLGPDRACRPDAPSAPRASGHLPGQARASVVQRAHVALAGAPVAAAGFERKLPTRSANPHAVEMKAFGSCRAVRGLERRGVACVSRLGVWDFSLELDCRRKRGCTELEG